MRPIFRFFCINRIGRDLLLDCLLKLLRFLLQIHGNIRNRKSTPRYQRSLLRRVVNIIDMWSSLLNYFQETLRINDVGSRRLPESFIRRVTDSLHQQNEESPTLGILRISLRI